MVFISKYAAYTIDGDEKDPEKKIYRMWAYFQEFGALVETEIPRGAISEIPLDTPIFSVVRKPYIPSGDFFVYLRGAS